MFLSSVNQTLKAMSIEADLPDDYWSQGPSMLRAVFFHRVMTKHIPIEILDREPIAGFDFNTASSRSQDNIEGTKSNKEMKD